jgi:hypothetical protein
VDGQPEDLTDYDIKCDVRKEIGREAVGELVVPKWSSWRQLIVWQCSSAWRRSWTRRIRFISRCWG